MRNRGGVDRCAIFLDPSPAFNFLRPCFVCGQVHLAVAEKSPAYRRLTDNESRLLDAFRNLPEPKRRLLVDFLSQEKRCQLEPVIPAKAGIERLGSLKPLDSCFRGNDGNWSIAPFAEIVAGSFSLPSPGAYAPRSTIVLPPLDLHRRRPPHRGGQP